MPVSENVQRARQQRYERRIAAAKKVIPHGPYCYRALGAEKAANGMPILKIKSCPFWKSRPDKPAQANGYCRFLKVGDFTGGRRGTMLLWDQVKECGINFEDDDLEAIAARHAFGENVQVTSEAPLEPDPSAA